MTPKKKRSADFTAQDRACTDKDGLGMLGGKIFVDEAQVGAASGIKVCRVGSDPVGLGSEWRDELDVAIKPCQR